MNNYFQPTRQVRFSALFEKIFYVQYHFFEKPKKSTLINNSILRIMKFFQAFYIRKQHIESLNENMEVQEY